jgi:1,4-dihydroxy-2-naphthoate octaprenyltransferase
MGIASLVLMGFWCLWTYYGLILLSMYIRVQTLKYYIKKQGNSKMIFDVA